MSVLCKPDGPRTTHGWPPERRRSVWSQSFRGTKRESTCELEEPCFGVHAKRPVKKTIRPRGEVLKSPATKRRSSKSESMPPCTCGSETRLRWSGGQVLEVATHSWPKTRVKVSRAVKLVVSTPRMQQCSAPTSCVAKVNRAVTSSSHLSQKTSLLLRETVCHDTAHV